MFAAARLPVALRTLARGRGLALAVLLAGPVGGALAQTSLPARATFGFETVKLPGGETMGLLRASESAELAPGWWLGASLYGAATGERGGLFTWGLEAERRWRIAPRWELGAGLYVGAGGGAAAPVGGGLMLRPQVNVMHDFGGWQAGISASRVRFASDSPIGSTQIGLQLSFDHRLRVSPPGVAAGAGSAIGIERAGLVVGRYARANANGSLGYVGARAAWPLSGSVAATMDLLGAAAGGADGFAEFNGGLLAMWEVLPGTLAWGAHLQAGLAGGGGVPVGGGPVVKASLALGAAWGDWSATLQAGQAKAVDGAFSSPFTQMSLERAFGRQGDPMRDTSIGFTLQHWPRAARKTGGEPPIHLIGFKLRREVGAPWYLAAQAHGAATGGAGAFSVGLVGAGAAWRPAAAPAWRIGAELAAGAAGGGGIDNGGGALGQALLWAGVDVGRHSRIEAGIGRVKSLRGALDTPLVEVGWTLEFGAR